MGIGPSAGWHPHQSHDQTITLNAAASGARERWLAVDLGDPAKIEIILTWTSTFGTGRPCKGCLDDWD
jgi:hypothetical protein